MQNKSIEEKTVVVSVDGGVCSQILFVAYGLELHRKYGYAVKYDLSWFSDFGRDVNGQQVRNWDFPKAFPGIVIDVASAAEVQAAKASKGGFLSVFGYSPERDVAFLMCRDVLCEHFSPALDYVNQQCLQRILSSKSCAIHVRRGDLSQGSMGYGAPTTADYYRRAIGMVQASLGQDTIFFVFSDDLDWARQNVVPTNNPGQYVLCEQNASDKGYIDLFLMAHCSEIISSIGSLGVFAAALSTKCQRLYVSRFREWVLRGLPNVVYINDDCPMGVYELASHTVYRKRGLWKLLFRIFRHLEKLLSVRAEMAIE